MRKGVGEGEEGEEGYAEGVGGRVEEMHVCVRM